MLPIQSFNPSATPAGGKIALNASDPGTKILFYNESDNNINLDFLNGNRDMLHAWEARWWTLDGNQDEIDWTIDSTLTGNGGPPPISKMTGTLYGPNEELPGTYPISLIRQISIGNTVSTVGGVASSVQDDGRASGNFTLEATPSPDGVSAAFIKNNGQAQLGSTQEDGQLDITNKIGDHMVITGDGIGIPSDLHRFWDTRTNSSVVGGFSAAGGVLFAGNNTQFAQINNAGLAFMSTYSKIAAAVGDHLGLSTDSSHGLQWQNTGTVLNGGTAGTATLWQPFTGSGLKLVLVELSGFRTAGANQSLALPAAFTAFALIWTGNIGGATGFNGLTVTNAGVAQNINIITSLAAAGGAASVNAGKQIFGNSFGQVFNPFDSVTFLSGSTGNTSGSFIIIGV